MSVRLLTPFGVSKLNRRLHWLVRVYTCQNATLEITCTGSVTFIGLVQISVIKSYNTKNISIAPHFPLNRADKTLSHLILFCNFILYIQCTVNSEIFARTLFSRNFAYAKFRENKTLAKWQNHSVVY